MATKILLVEDEPKVSAVIRRGLEEEGFEVTVAYDGTYGQRLALSLDCDLLTLDVILPGQSGLDVLRAVRAQTQDLPVLLLTALGTTQDKLLGFGGGADDYLVKAFDFAELLARVPPSARPRPRRWRHPTRPGRPYPGHGRQNREAGGPAHPPHGPRI